MEKPLFEKKHYNTAGHAHELTFSCYRRRRYFENEKSCEIFIAELEKAKKKHDFLIWAYVIMPNHVHVLIWPLNPVYDISRILQDFKSKTAIKCSKLLKNIWQKKESEDFKFWQAGGGFDRNLWNALAIHSAIKYIEGNPVRGGLAAKQELWQWSSAYARKNNTGLIPDVYKIPVLMK